MKKTHPSIEASIFELQRKFPYFNGEQRFLYYMKTMSYRLESVTF